MSRTNSSQPLPRARRGAQEQVTTANTGETSNGNASLDEIDSVNGTPKKGKQKSKGRQKRSKSSSSPRGTSWSELFTRIFLLWFTIYTLSVCPDDEHLKSPICRGLYAYRRMVLEPYIIPPIQNVLAHPSVAPYVAKVQPYTDQIINTAKPIALRTHQEWNNRVVPQWEKHIVPQWNKHVVPHLLPLEKQLDTIRSQVTLEYERRLGPHVRLATRNLHRWQLQAQPYVMLAAQKTYGGYQTAKPYVIPALDQAKVYLTQFLQFATALRRQYVDPQLSKIWDRVVELSGGQPRVTATGRSQIKPSLSKVARSVSPKASSIASTSSLHITKVTDAVGSASTVVPEVITPSESLPAVTSTEHSPYTAESLAAAFTSDGAQTLSSIASVFTESAQHTASVISSAVSSSVSSASSVVSEYVESAVPSASSLAEESIVIPASSAANSLGSSATSLVEEVPTVYSHVSEAVAETVSEVLSTASSLTDQVTSSIASLVASATPSLEDVISTASSAASSATSIVSSAISPSQTAITSDPEDVDLDDFYADIGLGLDDDLLAPDTPADVEDTPAPEITESEEEKAERLKKEAEEVAKKRADITRRHSAWEKEMDEMIVFARKVLRKNLVTLRKAATAELKVNKEIRKEVDNLVEDAEKFLKGADKYLATLKRETRRNEEKGIMWNKVISKVDSKFEERLEKTESVVNGWYNGHQNTEMVEVKRVSDMVRDVADRAQADIGLDYAWLDDVTYLDWQRYHDLARRSDNFTALALTIQNGSHPSPPINPVYTALTDLQSEVQDVVVGFETRLRRIKRNGERAFGIIASEDEDDESESQDEMLHILPIGDDSRKDGLEGETPADIPQIVIGRSKEEVMEAFNRVEEGDNEASQRGGATSVPEDKFKDPEEVVAAVVEDVENHQEHSDTSEALSHDEL